MVISQIVMMTMITLTMIVPRECRNDDHDYTDDDHDYTDDDHDYTDHAGDCDDNYFDDRTT